MTGEWKLVRVPPTPEMIEAGCRALHEMQGTGDADAPLHSPYQNSWDEPDSVRWRQWINTVAGDEYDAGIFRAMCAASLPAPAEVEPVAAEVFGTYQERDDGTKEFRRTGEPHSPGACGYSYWNLYTAEALSAARAQARREALGEFIALAEAEKQQCRSNGDKAKRDGEWAAQNAWLACSDTARVIADKARALSGAAPAEEG